MSNATSGNVRPSFPKRAVVTAGMPYGNKGLHFGHIGGVFVPADVYARFLRDRLGKENVVFVSGTDCYGSPIAEGYRKLAEEGFDGTIEDYVRKNHDSQKAALEAFEVQLDLYTGSGLDDAKDVHAQMSADIINRLHENGELERRTSKQFYDPEAQTFLNGRQVIGRCPVQGCKSEKAYADECDLGHQFDPVDLIAPISQLSGKKPEMRDVDNFYFDLPKYRDFLDKLTTELESDSRVRPVVTSTVREFLVPPIIYIKSELQEAYDAIKDQLPPHVFTEPEKGKHSFELAFHNFADRDEARTVLGNAEIRYRTGKALVPFRLTGNIEWGVPCPPLDGVSDLTVWVWPESLWAPISFTKTRLTQAAAEKNGATPARYASLDWRDWWCSEDAHVFQFIGQDNIYFYGVAQPALWEGLRWGLSQSTLVANHHIMFLGTKASSSGKVKPPLAHELLDYYTPEQLRAHWISLGLDKKSVSFSPKVYDPAAKDNERAADPALKESALLTNVFNRLARSCFYGAQNDLDGFMPAGMPDPIVVSQTTDALIAFENALHDFEFTAAFNVVDAYIREANKRWAAASKEAKNLPDEMAQKAAMSAALLDAFTALKAAAVMMHPIVPIGCEKICEYFQFAPDTFFSWDNAFVSLDELTELAGEKIGAHTLKELPPRTDFFEKHPSQY